MYIILLKDPDIPFEIRFNGREFRHRDFQNMKIFHEMIVFVGKRLAGQHHVVHGHSKLAGYGICSFFPFPGLIIEIVSPSAEHFGVIACVTWGLVPETANKSSVKFQ